MPEICIYSGTVDLLFYSKLMYYYVLTLFDHAKSNNVYNHPTVSDSLWSPICISYCSSFFSVFGPISFFSGLVALLYCSKTERAWKYTKNMAWHHAYLSLYI